MAEETKETHDDPSLCIEERKGAIFLFFLLLNPASVFVVELSEDKDKKEQENNCGFAYLKKPILWVIKPGDNTNPENIGSRHYPDDAGCD